MTSANQSSSSDTTSGIYNADGAIITGHIPTWHNLSQANRNIVMAERERLGLDKGKSRKGTNIGKSNGDSAANNRSK